MTARPVRPFRRIGELLARFRRVYALLFRTRRRRASVLAGLVCVPASAALVLWLPRLAGEILDRVATAAGSGADDLASAQDGLLTACLVFAGVALADGTLRFVARMTLVNASRYVEEELKADLHAHLGTLPAAWFDRARTGDIISRLTQDVELLRFVTGPTLLYGGQSLIVVPGGLWLMWGLSPWVAVAAIVAFVLLLVGLQIVLPRLQRHSTAVQEAIAAVSQRAAEDFGGIRVVQAFGRARIELATMRRLSETYLGHNVDLARLRAAVNAIIHGFLELIVLAVLAIGAIEAIRGTMTPGGFLEFYALIGVMLWPMLAAGWLLAAMPRAAAAADRVEEVFDTAPEAQDGLDLELRGDVEVRDLTFAYPGTDAPALENVSFTVRHGEKLGVVGPIGAGKSTLLAVLLRLYDPPRGTVFVDGHDVLDLAPRCLRRLFAIAPQEPFLFSDTLEGNVRFAADAAGVGDAVRRAGLEPDLPELPEGIATIVGERGVTLSGGQKQRTSLARALAAERPVLVLDDTLSAVDHATETRILDELAGLRGGRTMLVAAHRLSAVADADHILVLEDGRVTGDGTHDELVAATNGYYALAWRRQTESRALEGGGDA